MTRLLESLNLNNYCAAFEKNEVDGAVLVECESVEEVKELGIKETAIARKLFKNIIEWIDSGVPLELLSKVTCHY